jgi:hypothetical protein
MARPAQVFAPEAAVVLLACLAKYNILKYGILKITSCDFIAGFVSVADRLGISRTTPSSFKIFDVHIWLIAPKCNSNPESFRRGIAREWHQLAACLILTSSALRAGVNYGERLSPLCLPVYHGTTSVCTAVQL